MRNRPSGAVKSTFPGPRGGASILNADLVVVTADVAQWLERVCAFDLQAPGERVRGLERHKLLLGGLQ